LYRTTQLEERNKELQNFVRVASHDLKEPLRKITVFSGRLEDRCKEKLSERDQHYSYVWHSPQIVCRH
jgi:light-regulated signal transduction histidine kinase (bacteriophytochrome)